MSTRNNLYKKKWQKFLRRIWPFRFIPFVDFVLAAGSLATGNMREESDFDVIVGVRQGRIFTARVFCILAFGMFGWRAVHKRSNSKKWRDKICFNHFVTPNAYRLSPPHNEYWKKLYLNLVPVYGDTRIIQRFFQANADWMGEARLYQNDPRHLYKFPSSFKVFLEWILGGKFGDQLQRLKFIQIYFIRRGSAGGYKPRIIYNDNELEFHPDTKRIELLLSKEKL